MNIYLAGKIGYKDWRHAIVNGLEYANQDFDHDYYIEDWRVMNGAILGEHNYTGPFFISRGHGESHGDNTHGCDLYGHCIEDHGGNQRNVVPRLCMASIDRSDVIFCWMEDLTAYGSIFELGYAMGKGKQIYLAIKCDTGLDTDVLPDTYGRRQESVWEEMVEDATMESWADDIWFLLESVGYRRFDNVSDAWKAFCEKYNLYPIPESIKSPIEKQFFLQARRMGIDLEPQHEVNVAGKTYRIDFVYPGKPIAIELDGHDYHKTKEQRTADAQRERALQSMGWTVIRFTGTEIYHNTQKCVLETIRLSAGI